MRSIRHSRLAAGLCAALAAAALGTWNAGCVGNIGDGGTEGPANQPQSCGGTVVPVKPVPLRRLTPDQYLNTVRDLLGDPEFHFELEQAEGGIITERAVRQLRDAAELAIERRASWTAEVFPCELAGEGDPSCVDTLLDGFGARAFRRPLDADERSWLVGVFQKVRAEASFEEAMEVLVQVILQSPAVLYLFEGGRGETLEGGLRPLGSYELASRLSYFLWNTMPDAPLFEAAAGGDLERADGLRAQAERLLADPRAEHNIQRFFSGWLQLDGGQLHHPLEETEKDPTLFAEYDEALRAAMRIETEAFVRRTFFDEGGSFERLFSGTYAYVNGRLADLYGAGAPGDPESYQWVELDAAERAGLLTRAAFMTVLSTKNVTAPIRRGVWVLEEALCNQLGEPPPNANDTPVEGGEVINEDGEIELRTVRQDIEARTTEGECGGCHNVINPIGFAFENYDAIGRWQTEEVTSGLPVDATGMLSGSDVDGALENAIDLSERLGRSQKVRRCFAERWAASAFGSAEEAVDSCSQSHIDERFAKTGDMRELLLAIIESNAFRFVAVAEESP